MADQKPPLSFEEFIEAATAAAMRAATKVTAESGKPGEALRLPWHIIIGLILNDRELRTNVQQAESK